MGGSATGSGTGNAGGDGYGAGGPDGGGGGGGGAGGLVRMELPLMLDMEVQEYKHLQHLDLLTLVRVYLDLMDHHLVAHGSLVVVEEASTSITRTWRWTRIT